MNSKKLLPVSVFLLQLFTVVGLNAIANDANAKQTCVEVFGLPIFSESQVIERVIQTNPDLIPKGGDKTDRLMFGYESEYTAGETARILMDYRPTQITRESWQAKTEAERLEWMRKKSESKQLGNKDSGLTLDSSDSTISFLPKKPILDDTTNLELIIGPINEFSTWDLQTRTIVQRYGPGSQQAMVSIPTKFLFPSSKSTAESLSEVKGTFNFFHSFDILERMSEGSEKFDLTNPKPVLRTFAHPFLGPITLSKQTYMNEQLEQLSRGQGTWFDSLTAKSSKFIGSTTPRPDIGSQVGRMGAEIRDAHKDFEKLHRKTVRMILFFLADRSQMKAFANLKAVDTKADFETFSPAVKLMLEKLFPTRRDQTFGSAAEVFALEVFRNFAFPLKDWSADLVALGRTDILMQVKSAQQEYLKSLDRIASQFENGKLNSDQAAALVQGECAKFAVASGLHGVYSDAYNLMLEKIYLEISKETKP